MNAMLGQAVLTWFDAGFCLRLTQAMLHFLWQGSIVAAGYWVFDMARPQATARLKYTLGVLALLLMAACLPATFAVLPTATQPVGSSVVTLAQAQHDADSIVAEQPAASIKIVNQSAEVDDLDPGAARSRLLPAHREPQPTNREATTHSTPPVTAALLAAAPYATATYFAGTILMLLRLTAGLWGGRRLRQAATACDNPAILRLIDKQSRKLGMRFVPGIAWCVRISSPVVIGVLQPVILLPPALATGLSDEQFAAVLLHELAHIRRYDLLINIVQRLIEAMLFFHPAVWWLSRRIRIEREHASDDLAVGANCSKLQYAEALLRTAELCQAATNNPQPIAALAATGNTLSQFKRRIMRLLGADEQPRLRLGTAGLVLSMTLVAVLLIAPTAWRGVAKAENEPAAKTPQDQGTEKPKAKEPAAEKSTVDRKAILEEIKQLGGEWMPTSNDRKYLALRGPKVDDAFVERLEQLGSLEWLWLYDVAVTDVGIEHVGQMKGLTNLQIQSKHVTDAGIQSIAELKQLDILILITPELTDAGLFHLRKLPKLNYLEIWSNKISDEGLQELSSFEALRELDLRTPQITDKGLASLGEMRNLTGLSLNDVPITNAGLEHLKNLTKLVGLGLTNTAVTSDGMRQIVGLQELKQLTFIGKNVSDAAFVELPRFPKLTRIAIGTGSLSKEKSQITDEALHALSNSKNLSHVTFDTTSITDAGLLHLVKLPKLQRVTFLRSPGITQAGIDKFKAAMPKVPIEVFEPLPQMGANINAEPRPKENTIPISIFGRAVGKDAKPIAGAKIYVASRRGEYKRLAETASDSEGRYEFRDIPLPLEKHELSRGPGTGAFEVFGQAEGYGFAWRPTKWFYPGDKPKSMVPGIDEPQNFDYSDTIILDLKFLAAARLSGRIVDNHGQPIANSIVDIRYASELPGEGLNPKQSFRTVSPCGEFDSLNERTIVPPEMKIRKTDAEGRFEFAALPPNCRFEMDIKPPGFAERRIWAATKEGIKDHNDQPVNSDGTELVFARPVEVPIQVLYGDTREPAPKVFVNGYSQHSSHWLTSDEKGRVNLKLPPGEYKLHLLPAIGTPYLITDFEHGLKVEEHSPAEPLIYRLDPAAVVDIEVVDAETGNGIANADYWVDDITTGQQRIDHFIRCWEVATRISHVDRPRTDEQGRLRTLFKPGPYQIGIGRDFMPRGYEAVKPEGQKIACEAGKTLQLKFQLRAKAKVAAGE